MAIFEHLIIACPPYQANAIADRAAAAAGERLFGVFAPQIGLSINRLVVLTEHDGAIPATGPDWVAAAGAVVERHEAWVPAPRPAPGERLTDQGGYYSHRWFECRDQDWPRFQELSVTAWDNFEDVHDTRVVGFWKAERSSAPGITRVWLMAWYRDLAAWEGSRWYQASPDPAARQAFERFRERRALTTDSAVSILKRL